MIGERNISEWLHELSKQEEKVQKVLNEWTADLEHLRQLLSFAQCVPKEMRRHHSFVVESARMIDQSVDDMRWVLHEGGAIAKNANSMLQIATSAQCGLELLLETSGAALGAHKSLVKTCVRECKEVVSLAFSIRDAMSTVCTKRARLHSQLRERADLIRAGAQAIHDNMNADEAEENVRKLHVEVPHAWKSPWLAHEWLS